MSVCYLDFETRSASDLRKVGLAVYAAHPTTDVLCAAYAFDDGPVNLWKRGEPPPADLVAHLASGGTMSAYNAQFELAMWDIMVRRYGWPAAPLPIWRCTMVRCLAMALPGSLENAAAALGISEGKDMHGQRIMLSLAKPRRMEGAKPIWNEDPDRLEKLYRYCETDVETERKVAKRTLPISDSEQQLWLVDQIINRRGVSIDIKLARGAKSVIAETQAKLDARLSELTETDVTSATQVAALIRWLKKRGLDVESLAKDVTGEILAGDGLDPDVREVLEIRQAAAKASVAKIDAALTGLGADGRIRNLFQFHGASTGRWAGRKLQVQNLPRVGKKDDVDGMIESVATGKARIVKEKFGNPLAVVSKCLRGMIVPAAGRRFIVSDFSNVEGRTLAWLAGETWKIQAFRDYDTFVLNEAGERVRKGFDLYLLTAGRVLGKRPEDVNEDERQGQGKVPELALGFGGGPAAFASMAKVYGVRIGEHLTRLAAQDPHNAAIAHKAYGFRGKKTGMSEADWVAAEIIKMAWRAANPAIVAYWKLLDSMALEAVGNPGQTVAGGRVKMAVRGSFLWARLPSGRALCFPYPKIVERPFDEDDPGSATKPTVQFMGIGLNNSWRPQYAYGGYWSQQFTQATARDLLAAAIVRLERAGYPVVLHAHDEAVAEPAIGFGSKEEFERLMVQDPGWAGGLPLSSAGAEGFRYSKN